MIDTVLGGRYKILRLLGGGGFGQTYLAQDIQLPDYALCVVKQLKPITDDEFTLQTARRLFDREAKVLHHLGKHDRIPQLLAHFTENEEFYLVQEFIDGADFTDDIVPFAKMPDGMPVGRMNETQALNFLEDVLQTLVYVHQQGVIHRDIKPANLIRRRSDGKLVLIDFGAVKEVCSQVSPQGKHSALTVAVGTAGYMPNEQASGKPKPCSDLYALGVIAIQGLTGMPAHELGEDPMTGELAWRKSPKYAKVPYECHVSEEFAAFLDHMVRYDFRQRFLSAADALAALQALRPNYVPPTYVRPANPNHPQNHPQNYPSGWSGYDAATAADTGSLENPLLGSSAPQFASVSDLPTVVTNSQTVMSPNSTNISPSVPQTNPSPIPSPVTVPYETNAVAPVTEATNPRRLPISLWLGTSAVTALTVIAVGVGVLVWRLPQGGMVLQQVEPQGKTNNASNAPPTITANTKEQPDKGVCDLSKRIVADPDPPLNVRAGAGTQFPVVGRLNNGVVIAIETQVKGWLKIREPLVGWVAINRTQPSCR